MLLEVIFPLIGGIALLIYGIHITSDGIQKALAQRLKNILEKTTSNPLIGVLLGFIITAIIQSSSATTVIVVSLVNSGLMNLFQAVSIIFGANIGTTITAQIIALKITKYGFLIFTIGFLLQFLPFKRKVKYFGQFIMGFGLIFIAIEITTSSVSPLKNDPKIKEIFLNFGRIPVFGVLVGSIFTMIQQSSSVTVGIIEALGMEGLLDINSAFPMILGANIGTTITAIIASVGTNIAAKRTALAHVLFNIIGAIVFLLILNPYINFIKMLTPNTVNQIANSHTLFNIINTLIFLPFILQFVKLIKKIIPGEDVIIETGVKYLNKSILKSPIVAYDALIKEVTRLSSIVENNLLCLKELIFNSNKSVVRDIIQREETINYVNKEISRYVPLITSLNLPEKEIKMVPQILIISSQLERIGDLIDNTSQLEFQRIEERIPYSQFAMKELLDMFNYIYKNYSIVKENLFFISSENFELIRNNEKIIDEYEDEMREHHIERLKEGICSNEAGVIYLDVISNLERMGDHIIKIANIIYQSKNMI
ncbi:MAG TPA: Na/Pi cotransporter family protein [Caldisericia bacterium]|nr:Na/Pi cotransporter family protein [Caldisericia bacterium]HOL82374.1 Na/Pi cotransporter family protein [Caldisericia bacterium]HON82762.1 Na/Pi cotransporter family protein [Caldisericia bacterium]HPC56406.1 Na/Pi cotransporter family protein [Caldisericia bacterium]HPP43121.1 Na/Pi cotransporter family protein [Caldisericia bacterium]